MHKKFDIVDKAIVLSDKEDNAIDFYLNPDEKEKQNILTSFDIDEHTLSSALDPDEVSRVEFETDSTFIIWKRPNNYSFENLLQYNVSSI